MSTKGMPPVVFAVDPNYAKRVFIWTFGLTLLLKLWLAAAFPFTGDEAFFYQWGVYPDWGYSDHPPMVGWMLYGLNQISSHPLSLRFGTVLLWSVIALGMVDLLRRLATTQPAAPYWLGALFLALPFTWGLNVVTTDTPLIFFVFWSGYCFIRAHMSGRLAWFAASGVFLGLALLSKYFAGLLAIAYFVYLVRSRKGWLPLFIIAACALPFAAVNVAYNITHCWSNVMFNLVNRHEDAAWSVKTFAGYLAMLIYLVTPWVFVRLVRSGNAFKQYGPIVALFLVPFALFLILSTRKTIGLHWVLSFIPFVYLFYGVFAHPQELKKYLRWTVWFSVPHFLALAAIILLPVSVWEGSKFHDDIVFHKNTGEIVAALKRDLPQEGVIMATAYTPASLLSYHAQSYLPVFGEGKFHARQDDVEVDFRQYSGKPVRIFSRYALEAETYAPYLDNVTISTFDVAGVTYWVADGENFNYAAYRANVLAKIMQEYYRIPSALPLYGCGFLERYSFPRPAP